MDRKFSIGLDLGTNSVRALVADVATGEEVATSVWHYSRGAAGVLLDPKDPLLARQHPAEWVEGVERAVAQTLREAAAQEGFCADAVIGVGVDTTGSTPLPVDASGRPLAFQARFADDPNAMAWLWKDHTSHAEAEEITEAAAERRPRYLAKCGGTYSSEWFWSKMLHCRRAAPEVFEAAHTWVECSDWVPAMLAGETRPEAIRRNICAAGHKGMFNPGWGGYPDEHFLASVD
ncbi:MAG: ribulokinase, partial [Planctomycetes bacterium SM23_32]